MDTTPQISPAFLIDMHCHPSFKAHNQLLYPDRDLTKSEIVEIIQAAGITAWDIIEQDPSIADSLQNDIKKAISTFYKDSQSSLTQLKQGKVNCTFLAIHPFEMGWLNLKRDLRGRIYRIVTCLKRDLAKVGNAAAGIKPEKIEFFEEKVDNRKPIDYYRETFREYVMICESEQVTGPNNAKFKLVSNYKELRAILDAPEQDTLAGILTIEGAHAITKLPEVRVIEKRWDELNAKEQTIISNSILDNLKRLKGKAVDGSTDRSFNIKHVPFYFTPSHFFYNFLCGHCKTFLKPLDRVFGQANGSKHGDSKIFTKLGLDVINYLLNKTPDTKRILIDVKHMSYDCRSEYYKMVREINSNQDTEDHIPVICSHGAVTGFPDSHFDGDAQSDYDRYHLSTLSVNLFKEDIQAIVETDGILGLVTHEGRMPGKQGAEILKKLEELGKEDLLRKGYVNLVMVNIFFFIQTIHETPGMDGKKAWDHIALGSDYDGIMNPFNFYPTSDTFTSLFEDMGKYLANPDYDLDCSPVKITKEEVKTLLFDYTPQQIIDKIAHRNVENFLSVYFTDEYLYEKRVLA